MNTEQLNKYKKFYTIEKQEFNFFAQKMINKKYKFYTGDILPPNYKEIINPLNKKDILELYRPIKSNNTNIGFKQNNIPEEIKERFAENIQLQAEIMRIIKKRINDWNYNCGIIKAKTGMGKTHIIMDIIEYLQTTTLILVSNKKLMQEMIDKFIAMTNFKPGQYGDGKKEIDYITIMTKKSFNLCDKKELSDFDTIIIDEAHQGFTSSFRDWFNKVYSNKDIYFYGLSATPSTNELNEADLEKYYGKSIEVKKSYDFIPKFTFYNYCHIKEYEFENYPELRTKLSEDNDRFMSQTSAITLNLSNCSLILCDRISEIEQYYEFYNQDKFNVIKITGETKIEDDKQQLEDSLKNNKPTIIIGSIQKCSTGFDHPTIDTVFIFSAIKFENTVIQSIGRSLRKSPGKKGAHIYIWNDKILDKQRVQKQKAIFDEYGVAYKDIENIYINKERKQKSIIALTF